MADTLSRNMPEISRFLGIVIGMLFIEYGAPNFHVVYGEHEATIEIDTERVHGYLPARICALALEWSRAHRSELHEDWRLARAGEPLRRIPPLE